MATSTTHRQSGPKPSKDLAHFTSLMNGGAGGHFHVVLLGVKASDWPELMRIAARGLTYDSLEHFQRNTGIAYEKLLAWVQISPRTMARRKQQRRFLPGESDRLLRASRVFGKALELFEGDRDAASEWMLSPQPALGGATPIDVAQTELGSREIENLVGRIEHGVYS
jgi:putative toxin-antitoxin system antitoxin component (TIGR02293 family)